MDDRQIITLYWQRDSQAIPQTAEKYGKYCLTVAKNILGSPEDAEECVNDTWLKAWNTIPPQKPKSLCAYLASITRNLALNLYKMRNTAKRGHGQTALVLDELQNSLCDEDPVGQAVDQGELTAAINDFLSGLPEKKRHIFICRYWYFDSIADIAVRFGMTENHVSVTLNRLRARLGDQLTERGFDL